VTVAVRVPFPDEDGEYWNDIVLGESLTWRVFIVWPFSVKVIVPGNCAYWASVNGWVPWVTVAVIVQVWLQLSGAVRVTVGGLSLQLWTSSVAEELVLALVLLEPVPIFCLPPLKISMFHEAALELAAKFLARGGVQLVATLPDTLSIVWEEFLAAAAPPPMYQPG
jgi:hypothetical protein